MAAVLPLGSHAVTPASVTQVPVITGEAVPSFTSIDQAVVASMQRHVIPGASIAVTKAGRLVFARGYGYADVASRSPIQPDAIFRLASVAKPLTATAADVLVARRRLAYDTRAFSVLADVQPFAGVSLDPRVQEITVHQLMNHRSGWSDATGGNRYGHVVAAAARAGHAPPGLFRDLLRYELGSLDYGPGTKSQVDYCNFCYGVLAEVVQAAAGKPYERFVIEEVLQPIGATRTRIAGHRLTDRFRGEVTYYTDSGAGLVPSVYSDTPPRVPVQYGGFPLDWGTGSAAGGWVSTTIDMLRLVAAVTHGRPPTVFSSPPRTGFAFSALPIGAGWAWRHDGSMPGTATTLHIIDDVAWCVLANTNVHGDAFIGEVDTAIQTFVRSVTSWPTADLFPRLIR